MSTYRVINGQRWLVDDWRLAQATRLRELCSELGRPVLTRELADALGVETRDVTHMALVKNGYALLRQVPGVATKGLWPRDEQAVHILEALAHFRRLPLGTSLAWKEPRRTRTKQFRARKLTVSKTLRSRVQSGLRRARNHLGLRSLRECRDEHLRLIPDVVWSLEMEASLITRTQWQSRTPDALRARKSASNRRSEIAQFLSWAEWQKYLSLDCLRRETLPEAWTRFVTRVSGSTDGGIDVAARRLAKIAYSRMQADSPERLVEIGFGRMEELMRADPRYRSTGSVKATLSRLRTAWNAAASAPGHSPLPRWPSRPRVRRLADGGLIDSWWSASAFVKGNPTLLDRPGMEYQRRQARDMRDWWTLSDPTLRPESEGGALPPRPERSRQGRGRKPFGARSETEITAVKPLAIVSALQRFAMCTDEIDRLDAEQLRQLDWSELFADRARIDRYIRHVFEASRKANGSGRITEGVRKVWYVYTIMWAYFPAGIEMEIQCSRDRRLNLRIDSADGVREAQQLELERARHERRIETWQSDAAEVMRLIKNLLVEFGGTTQRKNKTEIRDSISHVTIRRIANALRDRRLALEAQIRSRTDRLVRQHEKQRKSPCERLTEGRQCGTLQCDTHNALPRLSKHGLAREMLNRRYCILVTQEAMLRLHAILPWRPGTLRRALVGTHIDPVTLEITVRGRDDKVDTDSEGKLKWQKARIPDMDWWDHPDEVEDTVRVLRLLIDVVRLWLWDNPTRAGQRLRRPGDDRRLLLNSYGVPWRVSGTYTTSFQAALTAGASLVNEHLAAGEAPITLPTGYGATGSYIMRFLYGHRIKTRGGSFSDIASALGNSEATARKHYHDEHEMDTLSRLARQHRKPESGERVNIQATSVPGSAQVVLELKKARAAFEKDVDGLDLSDSENARLWQAVKAELLGALDEHDRASL